jgi:hypothetical protein
MSLARQSHFKMERQSNILINQQRNKNCLTQKLSQTQKKKKKKKGIGIGNNDLSIKTD